MFLIYVISTLILLMLGDAKKLSVTSVTTLNSTSTSKILFGSAAGGTLLYIKGTGF